MSGSIGELGRLLELAQKNWHRPTALIAAFLIAISVLTGVFALLKPELVVCAVVYFIAMLLVVLAWWWSNRLPRTPKGKVGFVISLHVSEESEHSKVKEDFILTLHEILKGGAAGDSFRVITVPQHIAARILDQDDALALRIKCRACFVIYGRIRLRTIAGSDEHVLHLEGLVTHRPLAEDASQRLSREFAELFPRRVRFAEENDVFSFAITSAWINCVARYIIGIAAACSGDLDYAEKLQKDVERLLAGRDQAFPIFAKLKQRVPLRLAEIRYARAWKAYDRWLTTRDPTDMETVGRHLDSIPAAHTNAYGILLSKSIYLFVRDRDVKGAMAVLKKCRGQLDGTWLYNLAFLHAYIGDLRGAIRRYRSAMKLRVGEAVPVQVEAFMCWLLEQEPDKYQLYYCLGFINWKVKGDAAKAIHDFEAFLSSGEDHEFTKERELARKWVAELRSANQETN